LFTLAKQKGERRYLLSPFDRARIDFLIAGVAVSFAFAAGVGGHCRLDPYHFALRAGAIPNVLIAVP
jgi:hypothetical protein